ncbi:hypothetical protein O7599_12645 [Streptomyces sp. WMMC500]|uniref:hypothetical protein n=1 Tax=Streptomyces sp. WMMC500 TaxID=3015154 RepID=UPI00248CBD08|nr:hypothetical protein [Streptomyces sp. WMMC500]WBB63319.1 hypothetical protein O7599_12645 [Streptomyces sp. WMMC500]
MATGTTERPPSPDQPGGVHAPGRAAVAARHLRTDRWWLQPAVTFAGLTVFIIYSTWRAFVNDDYYAAPYVSPFYSPCLGSDCVDMKSGPNVALFGDWWFMSPAIIILIFPLGFRFTCYYYRKAYYRSFWASPPACAVAEPHKTYTGETRFPLIVQNLHRYFFYAAVAVALILTYDAVLGFRNSEYEWGHVGLGTIVLWINVVLIWLYTLSCHSCRHIVGGRLRHFSKHPLRYRAWGWVGKLNKRHAQLAWASLISVGLADLYVYLLASGAFDDPVLF